MLLYILILFFIILLLLFIIRSNFELKSLVVKEAHIVSDKLKNNINITFVTDLHENDFGDDDKKLIDTIINEGNDLIIIGGDLPIAYKHANLGDKCSSTVAVNFLNNLMKSNTKNIPIVYGYGNHEDRLKTNYHNNEHVKIQYDNLYEAITNNKYNLIENSFFDFNDNIRIYSLTLDYKYYKPKLEIFKDAVFDEDDYIEKRIGKLDDTKFNILLLHNPDFAKVCIDYGFDLILSGHYHGGLVYVPLGLNFISPNLKMFPKYIKGTYKIKDKNGELKTLIVSGGLGTHTVNARLNNKPQLIKLILSNNKIINKEQDDKQNNLLDNKVDININDDYDEPINDAENTDTIVSNPETIKAHAEFKDGQINYKLETFEGPLDLLLQLIERNKINIYDIPIAEITRQYMDYMATLSDLNMEISSEFVVMAANLLEIKSKMLLPFEIDENGEEVDPRAELVERLLEHKRYKSYGDMLKQNDDVKSLYRNENITKEVANYIPPVDIDALFKNIDIEKLNSIFKEVLERKENSINLRNVGYGKLYKERIPLKTKIVTVLEYSKEVKQFSFRKMLEESQSKTEVIVTFLAILELIKMGKLQVSQEILFGDININYIENETAVDLSMVEDE